MSLRDALFETFGHPWRLLTRWNWKAALLSCVYRGPVFFAANLSGGWSKATAAMLVEFMYLACVAGIYAALTQSLRKVEPPWRALAALAVVIPAIQHSLELLVHRLQGTPNLGVSIAASVCLTLLSSSFNLYAMRRDVFIVGQGRQSLASDLLRFPFVLAGFLRTGAVAGERGLVWIWSFLVAESGKP